MMAKILSSILLMAAVLVGGCATPNTDYYFYRNGRPVSVEGEVYLRKQGLREVESAHRRALSTSRDEREWTKLQQKKKESDAKIKERNYKLLGDGLRGFSQERRRNVEAGTNIIPTRQQIQKPAGGVRSDRSSNRPLRLRGR